MDREQLITELEALGTVTFCDIIEGTSRYGIGMTINVESQSTLDSFDNIINIYLKPTYNTTIDKIMESGSIKAIFE